MQADRDLMELTYRALYDSPYAKTAWQEFATVFGGLELGDKLAQYPAMYDRYINPPPVTTPPVTTPPTTNPGTTDPGSSNPGSQPTRPSPVANYSSTVTLISNLNAIFQGKGYGDLLSAAVNAANFFGLSTVSKVLSGISAFITGYKGNPVAATGQLVQAFGGAMSSYFVQQSSSIAARTTLATLTKSVLLRATAVGFLAGAAITTWGYVLEQASYIDQSSVDSTNRYILEHPDVFFEELGRASIKVATDLGSAFIGSLGGIRKFW